MAIHTTVMGTSGGRDVHPFFSFARDKTKSLNARTNLTKASSSTGIELSRTTLNQAVQPPVSDTGHENLGDTQLPSTAPAENEVKSINRADHKASKPKRAPRNVETPHKNIDGYRALFAQVRVAANIQNPTGDNEADQELDITSIDLEVDPNDSRRKRQRTAPLALDSSSVGSTLIGTWEEQLRAAAHKPEEMFRVAEPHHDELAIEVEDASPELGASSEPSVELHSTISPEDGPPVWKALDPQSKQTSPVKNGTPKKKMLRIRNDGTLISPKARPGAGMSKQIASPKRRGRKRMSRTKIIILKYGNDLETRATAGMDIQAILDRPASERAMPTGTIYPKDRPMSREPLKPTHPFFLGKPMGEYDITSGKTALPENGAQAMPTGTTSPQKKTPMITPDAAKAWAALGGLGHRFVGTDSAKLTRFPGAIEPLLPPRDMQHIRGLNCTAVQDLISVKEERIVRHEKKLKDSVVQVHSADDVLCPFRRSYEEHKLHAQEEPIFDLKSKIFRKPQRRLMTGPQLQEALRPHVVAKLPSTTDSKTTGLSSSAASTVPQSTSTHSALINIFNGIANSFTAFDNFQCESQDWAQKYSPKCTTHVLQHGREAVHLRDWLQSLTVVSIDPGSASKIHDPGISSKSMVKPKRKRRRAEELDGFVISSDEEANDMDELTDLDDVVPTLADIFGPKKSMIRNEGNPGLSTAPGASLKASNAVVISGPHGCGKTAAVYAAAHELGFEVFEINAGSRRSGKDLLDRVGDMARNHLVHQKQDLKNSEDLDVLHSAVLQEDIETGRQSTMQSFFKSKPNHQAKAKRPAAGEQTNNKQLNSPKQKQSKQKQSLILLEEVDILFEEDKQFWATALALISQSRRPIVMTCTDESRLPFDEMVLHAIFRFSPPSEQLAVDYLVLLAGNEGHLLSRDSVSMLYKSRNYDLRASISELNFWCQMAIGDTKGGLEWMLIRSNIQECHNEQGQALRVVSDGSYLEGMGFLSRDRAYDGIGNEVSDEIEMLSDLVREWDYDVEDWCQAMDSEVVMAHGSELSPEQSRRALTAFDVSSDLLSAADTLPNIGSRRGNTVSQSTLGPVIFANSRRYCSIRLSRA